MVGNGWLIFLNIVFYPLNTTLVIYASNLPEICYCNLMFRKTAACLGTVPNGRPSECNGKDHSLMDQDSLASHAFLASVRTVPRHPGKTVALAQKFVERYLQISQISLEVSKENLFFFHRKKLTLNISIANWSRVGDYWLAESRLWGKNTCPVENEDTSHEPHSAYSCHGRPCLSWQIVCPPRVAQNIYTQAKFLIARNSNHQVYVLLHEANMLRGRGAWDMQYLTVHPHHLAYVYL